MFFSLFVWLRETFTCVNTQLCLIKSIHSKEETIGRLIRSIHDTT